MATGYVVTPGSGESVSWADVAGKPATFPPETHTHAYADITGKPATFTPSAHTHAIADVTALQAALDGKADSAHEHVLADITDYVVPTPIIRSWNGSAYVVDDDAAIYIGPSDPGSVPDGSLWIDTSA